MNPMSTTISVSFSSKALCLLSSSLSSKALCLFSKSLSKALCLLKKALWSLALCLSTALCSLTDYSSLSSPASWPGLRGCVNAVRRCALPGDLQGRSRQFYEDILHVISHFNIEFKGVADCYPSWWYEDIWHVISHFNIEFKGVADFNSSWWYEDIWHVISHFNI